MLNGDIDQESELLGSACMLGAPMMQQNVFVWPLPSNFLCAWLVVSVVVSLCVVERVMFCGAVPFIFS